MASVKVPNQLDGEIVVSRSGADPVRYPVVGGLVEIEDEHVSGFLSQVPGAEISAGKADARKPSKEAQ